MLMNLNIWDTIKKDAAKAGHELVDGAEWCYSNPTCKADAEKYGLAAAKLIYSKMHHKTTTATTLQNLNLWDTIKSDAEKVGSTVVKGADWCLSNATCNANAKKYGTQAALAIANKVSLQNLSLWDTIKSDAEKAGTALVHGAEWCYSNATCKANAEKYGTQAALVISNKVEGKVLLVL